MGNTCVRARIIPCLILGLGLLLLGCAASDAAGGDRAPGTPVVVAPTAGKGTGAGGTMDFGNGTSRAGGPAIVMMMPPPTQTPGAAGGVLEPVSIDQCLPTNPANLAAPEVEEAVGRRRSRQPAHVVSV